MRFHSSNVLPTDHFEMCCGHKEECACPARDRDLHSESGTCTTKWKVKSKKCLVSAVNCAPYAYELSALTCDQLSDATEEAA